MNRFDSKTLDALERHGQKRLHLDTVFHEVHISCKDLFALVAMARESIILRSALLGIKDCNAKYYDTFEEQVLEKAETALADADDLYKETV